MSAAAPTGVRLLRQGVWDLRAVLANGEQLLVTFLLPVGVLVGVLRTGVPSLAPLPQETAALAGALGVAVLSSAFTGQAIAVGFDRRAGVLRLLGTTALGRSGMLGGRLLAVCAVVLLQTLLLLVVAAVLGVGLQVTAVLAVVPAVVLGTSALLGAALLLAGTVRAEGVLGAANLIWVLALAFGGLVLPAERLPGGAVVQWLPPAALGDALRAALVDGVVAVVPLACLAGWTLLLSVATARTFRWD